MFHLQCSECQMLLDETHTCFVRDGKTFCKKDYIRWAKTIWSTNNPQPKSASVLAYFCSLGIDTNDFKGTETNTDNLLHVSKCCHLNITKLCKYKYWDPRSCSVIRKCHLHLRSSDNFGQDMLQVCHRKYLECNDGSTQSEDRVAKLTMDLRYGERGKNCRYMQVR